VFTFSFKGTDIKDVAPPGSRINVTDVSRPVIYPRTRHKVKIPGRAGTWDFPGSVAEDYTVSVELAIIGDAMALAVECAEEVRGLIQGQKGTLVFSDQPEKEHGAEVYEAIMMRHDGAGNIIRASIVFECDAQQE